MNKLIKLLIGVGIIVLVVVIFLLYVKPKYTNIEDRKDVLEVANQGEYTVFIEDKGKGVGVLKIYDGDTNMEEEAEGIIGNLHGIKWSKDGRYFIVTEGTDMVGTTYIIPVENREDIASIRTIGEVIWSPDSSKLLIGVENHQNESIDLAIYYINSQIVEPLIEADKYTDYLPKYWDESNHIGYVKINDDKEEEHSYKYDLSKEEELMNIILSGEEKHVSRAIALLPELDYDKLEKIYGEGSVIDLLRWLSDQEIDEIGDIAILIDLMDGFIGEEYFIFVESLGNTYIRDKIKFIKALSNRPEKIEEVAYALNDIHIYDREDQSIVEDLDMIVNSKELNDEQKRIGIDLINYYAACGT
ncbi:hypothetical protein [Clostridium sp. Cult3]|uniref:hypothetical protein n=1 Tax=Clostridium sp. Cult3 TaxID=2079004 RepID=UPI001F24AE70|nr:hypothetical protein [Clostridium sp. Cult3]MCF6459554.1 hypothetical protein [Clostridium sp. Cult3]